VRVPIQWMNFNLKPIHKVINKFHLEQCIYCLPRVASDIAQILYSIYEYVFREYKLSLNVFVINF